MNNQNGASFVIDWDSRFRTDGPGLRFGEWAAIEVGIVVLSKPHSPD